MYLTNDSFLRTASSTGSFAGYASLRGKLEKLVAELPAVTADRTLAWNWTHVELLLARSDLVLEEMKAWLDAGVPGEEDAASRLAILCAYQRLASLCEEYARAMSRRFGCSDVRSLRAIAFCLHYLGETCKHSTGRGMQCAYPALHALWKLAAASGHESDALSLPVDGHDRQTSIDRLYMRALVLAWGVQIGLAPRQMQVFDGWIWSWMTALECCEQLPRGAALRADPEAPFGLSTRVGDATARNALLSRRELESALRMLSAELAAGRTVPAIEGGAEILEVQRHTLAAILRAVVAAGGA